MGKVAKWDKLIYAALTLLSVMPMIFSFFVFPFKEAFWFSLVFAWIHYCILPLALYAYFRRQLLWIITKEYFTFACGILLWLSYFGSQTIRVQCWRAQLDDNGMEIDREYRTLTLQGWHDEWF